MVRLFFMIPKILSCERRVLRMTVLNSSSYITFYQHVGATCSVKYAKSHLQSYFERSSWKQANKSWEYGVGVCVWLDDEEHQLIGIDYQPIDIEDSMTQYYIEFNEDRRGESRFWDHTFPQAEFAYNTWLTVQHDFLVR